MLLCAVVETTRCRNDPVVKTGIWSKRPVVETTCGRNVPLSKRHMVEKSRRRTGHCRNGVIPFEYAGFANSLVGTNGTITDVRWKLIQNCSRTKLHILKTLFSISECIFLLNALYFWLLLLNSSYKLFCRALWPPAFFAFCSTTASTLPFWEPTCVLRTRSSFRHHRASTSCVGTLRSESRTPVAR